MSVMPDNRVLWLEDLPDFKPDPIPQKAEVLVAGAGITGVSLALHLKRKGVDVVLVEARHPAWGASGRNAGHMLSGTAEYYARAVEVMGRDKAACIWSFSIENRERLAAELLKSRFDTGYQKTGYLACALDKPERQELERSVQLLREDGFDEEYWTAEQLERRYGRHDFLGARHSPEDAIVHPARSVWALLEEYRALGGKLCCPVSVIHVDESAEGLRVELRKGEETLSLDTTMVAWCLNAWTGTLLPTFKDLVVPVRGQMIATERLHKVFAGAMAANFGYEYWRQAAQGEVVLGGWRWSQKELEIGEFSEELNPEIHAGLEEFLRVRFPKLQKTKIQQAWTGVMGFSRDGLPWVGAVPGRSGQVVAAGFTGHGFGLAWNCTRLLAEEMIEGRSLEDLKPFRPQSRI